MPQSIIKTAQKSEKGAVLLVTILLLSAIMIISFAVATLAQRDIRAAGDMLRGEASLYAADSALEEVLYRLKQGESLEEILASWDDGYTEFLSGIENLEYIVTAVPPGDNSLSGSLAADETDQIDLAVDFRFDDEEILDLADTDNIDGVVIDWQESGDNAWLEWTLVRWPKNERIIPFNLSDFEDDPTNLFNNNALNVTLFKGVEPPPLNDDRITTIDLTNDTDGKLATDFYFILRVKALYDYVNYEVNATLGGLPVGVPGVANIQAIGRRGENKRALEFSINQTRGAEGFTDFVLYSDETIEKF